MSITSDELDRFKEAFKSENFREMFVEYCKEMSDPENRRIYEDELKQLEAERGNDVIFINPEPGFVIKTSTNNYQKVFINVASCDNIERPSSKRGVDENTGEKGLNWRIPYVQSKPKHDFDKTKKICAVYDVVFHPDTLHLANKNPMFKKLVINTACDAVKTAFDIKLDTCNLKYPKMLYKGTPTPAVIRKKCQTDSKYEKSIDDNIFAIPTAENHMNENVKLNKQKTIDDDFSTPKYELIHRRHVEMHELTYEMDAKLNITMPKELVIKIDLPLLSSSKDVVLDVNTRSIHLFCDKLVKYKLDLPLPYEVDKEIGLAQFDSSTKILTITLPVLKESQIGIADLCRTDDSGVESDHHSPKDDSIALENDVFEHTSDFLSESQHAEPFKSIQSPQSLHPSTENQLANESFLDPAVCYALPHFTYNRFENIVAFTLHVKNVLQDSIIATNSENVYRLKFSSIGSGYFKNNYAFYFSIPINPVIIRGIPRVEAWDNNVVIQIELDSIELFHSYKAGLNDMECKEFICYEQKLSIDNKSKTSDVESLQNSKINYVEIETAMSHKELQIEIKNKNFIKQDAHTKQKKSKSIKKKARSLSESHCDDLKQNDDNLNGSGQTHNKSSQMNCYQHESKLRTQSESSNDEHHMELIPLKGILKRHSSYDRATPEFSSNERGCSVDLGIGSFKSIPEERDSASVGSNKKSVRFDKNLCRKLLFRMNSTIIGQRKPKENKRKKKKRCQGRRYSEGEASDYENHLQLQPCGDKCQNIENNNNSITSTSTSTSTSTTSSNNNQNKRIAQAHSSATKFHENELKNNLIFDIEI